MRRVVVLSGKGGVGKTTVSAVLSLLLSRKVRLVVADCDVDTPNLGLMLGLSRNDYSWSNVFESKRVIVDESKCNGCGACINSCVFNALSINDSKLVIDSLACDGCGSCIHACPFNALSLITVKNGSLGIASTRGFSIVSGELIVGSHGSGRIVDTIKSTAEGLGGDLLLIDSAAGIGCPVISSVKGSDFAVLVTEPTPAAISDLRRAIELLNQFSIPYLTIINKSDLNPGGVKTIKRVVNGRVFLIPYSNTILRAVVNLNPELIINSGVGSVFYDVIDFILRTLFN